MAYKHYLRIIHRWPKDLLRPEVSFQHALRQRIAKKPARASDERELGEVNALYSLLEDRYSQNVHGSA